MVGEYVQQRGREQSGQGSTSVARSENTQGGALPLSWIPDRAECDPDGEADAGQAKTKAAQSIPGEAIHLGKQEHGNRTQDQ